MGARGAGTGPAEPPGAEPPGAGTLGVERGSVERFDQEAGLGEVRAWDGRVLAFHCTEIAGGSREIAPGTEVTFEVAPGHLGLWEARSVTPL